MLLAVEYELGFGGVALLYCKKLFNFFHQIIRSNYSKNYNSL